MQKIKLLSRFFFKCSQLGFKNRALFFADTFTNVFLYLFYNFNFIHILVIKLIATLIEV